MITNERQLQNAKVRLGQFQETLTGLEREGYGGIDALLAQAQKDALLQQVRELDSAIQEYEDLKQGRVSAFELDTLADLPLGLIKARIASSLTQKDLAQRLNLKEQQIQRYESELYQSCSFARLVEIADALEIKVRERIELQDLKRSVPDVIKRLNSMGLESQFIKNRIDRDIGTSAASTERVIGRAAMIFNLPISQLLSDQVPDPPGLGAAMARFKMPRGRDARNVAAYTAYAHKLASICANATRNLPLQSVPHDWKSFRQGVITAYGKFDLESVTHFAWDCGVVVLPLNDSGAFHGATWRFAGRNVVVLKQRSNFGSRWLSDLVHELFHAGEEPERSEFEVVELPETSEERRQLKSEQHAERFSSEAILGGRAEELTQICVSNARGRVQLLKDVVQRIAKKESVNQGVLANYIAFRLSMEGINWWGTATNLQTDTLPPLNSIRDIFFERFDFQRLSDEEYAVLSLALNDGIDHGGTK